MNNYSDFLLLNVKYYKNFKNDSKMTKLTTIWHEATLINRFGPIRNRFGCDKTSWIPVIGWWIQFYNQWWPDNFPSNPLSLISIEKRFWIWLWAINRILKSKGIQLFVDELNSGLRNSTRKVWTKALYCKYF